MATTKEKISYLQQAVWKLESAKDLVWSALDVTDVASETAQRIQALIDDLNADLDELGR